MQRSSESANQASLPDPSFADASLPERAPDGSLVALCRVAGFHRIAADAAQLEHELALQGRRPTASDLCRAAALIGLKSRLIKHVTADRLARVPMPAIIGLRSGGFAVLLSIAQGGSACILEAEQITPRMLGLPALLGEATGEVILLARQDTRPSNTTAFGLKWFLPALLRHKATIGHVLIASLFVQIFALITPLFFQIVVDKVLAHKGVSTLVVVTVGMVGLSLFNVLLQFLRSYALSHTTTRIDVELGARLFNHILRLPLGYFETRAAGQTVARLRELETIRSFITGQALFSLIDLLFAFVFIGVLFAYSPFLAVIALCSVPAYGLITGLIRPMLREKIRVQFDRGAANQQFLVETVIGIHTLKALAVEPAMQALWEEKLTGYVKSAFETTTLGTFGQNAIQYVSSLSTAAIIFFGAEAVIGGSMSIGQLIAFNMIAGQLTQPILRLSQLFQDFQQVQVSVERLGDVLNTPAEPQPVNRVVMPPVKGALEFKSLSFRYRAAGPLILDDISLSVRPGETIGIVGPSGSGKSTLSKLLQRFYVAESGNLLIDGADVALSDPSWLRRQIGVVLQENTLFNRTIHENIAFADPAMPRAHVIKMAQLAGAHDFITSLPQGYDTMVEERGANLSGGQRQRIAIARALSNDPRILIFDEATSALDYESERIIQTNMSAIVKGRTVIVIAHRLSTVRFCDRIVGMQGGRIVEIGSHDQLIGRENGLYARLSMLQSGQTGAAA